jgi:hypothetical protein
MNMPLSKDQIDALLRLVGVTEEVELNCDQCLSLVAEFAEQQLRGQSIRTGLQAVQQHLSVCSECREEFEALRVTLVEMDCDNDA